MEWAEMLNEMYWYFLTVSFLFGAITGSFLNVVIYRLPTQGMSIVKPRSFCPSCKKPIAGYDNIPLFSYLLLQGKCRHCQTKIGIRYFCIELLTGLFALGLFHLAFGVEMFAPHVALIYFVFICAMICISFIDIDLFIIPDLISLPAIPIGLACSFFMPQGFVSSLIGAAIGAGALEAVRRGYYLVTKTEGMGVGDIKLMGMIGAFLGWQAAPFSIMVGSLAGLVYGIIFVILPGKGRKTQIPFGPFLAFGAVLYIFIGPQVVDWYFSMFRG